MIYIACDHAGYKTKLKIMKYLERKKIPFVDLGVDSEKKSANYAIVANSLCPIITEEDAGILICGSGIGMSIACNRYDNIRGALCYNVKSAELARKHNNANVLILRGRFGCDNVKKKIVKTFFSTAFEGGRHIERLMAIGTNKQMYNS